MNLNFDTSIRLMHEMLETIPLENLKKYLSRKSESIPKTEVIDSQINQVKEEMKKMKM